MLQTCKLQANCNTRLCCEGGIIAPDLQIQAHSNHSTPLPRWIWTCKLRANSNQPTRLPRWGNCSRPANYKQIAITQLPCQGSVIAPDLQIRRQKQSPNRYRDGISAPDLKTTSKWQSPAPLPGWSNCSKPPNHKQIATA